MHLSLVEECRRRVEQALASLDAGGEDARHNMKLHAALGSALVHQKGSGLDVVAAWTRGLELAERLDDTEYRLRALWGLYADQYYRGDLRAALALVERYRSLAIESADPVDAIVGDRMYAVPCSHWMRASVPRAMSARRSSAFCQRVTSRRRSTCRRWLCLLQEGNLCAGFRARRRCGVRRVHGSLAGSGFGFGCGGRKHSAHNRAWKTKPSWYAVSTEDHIIPPDSQRQMATRAGATVIEVEGSHVAFVLSQTAAIANLIEDAATNVGASQ
jgi:pimeloyl-ACP methyl ester carboxylesterase